MDSNINIKNSRLISEFFTFIYKWKSSEDNFAKTEKEMEEINKIPDSELKNWIDELYKVIQSKIQKVIKNKILIKNNDKIGLNLMPKHILETKLEEYVNIYNYIDVETLAYSYHSYITSLKNIVYIKKESKDRDAYFKDVKIFITYLNSILKNSINDITKHHKAKM